MVVYILLFLFFIFISWQYPNNKKIGYFSLALFFFLAAFRGEGVGTDTSNYLTLEDALNRITMSSFDIWDRPEILYIFLCKYLIDNNVSPQVLIIIFSAITVVFLWLTIIRAKISPVLSCLVFLLYFYLLSLNISRQIAASSILLFGYTFLIGEKKSPWFFVCVIVATMIHAASAFSIVLWFVASRKFNKSMLVWVASFLFIINLISPISMLGYVFELLPNNFFFYKYSENTNVFQSNFFGKLIEVFTFVPLLLAFVLKATDRTNVKDNIFYVGLLFMVFTFNINSNVARISLIFTIFNVVYLCELFMGRKKSLNVSLLFWFIVIFNTFIRLYDAASGKGQIVPYYFMF